MKWRCYQVDFVASNDGDNGVPKWSAINLWAYSATEAAEIVKRFYRPGGMIGLKVAWVRPGLEYRVGQIDQSHRPEWWPA